MKIETLFLSLFIIFSVTDGSYDNYLNFEKRVISAESAVNLTALNVNVKSLKLSSDSRSLSITRRTFNLRAGWVVSENRSYSLKKFCEYPPWSKGTCI